MRRLLVSTFLADVTQQIHSFRANGVISAQRLLAATSDSMALRKSDGSLWIAPPAIALVVMRQVRVSHVAERCIALLGFASARDFRKCMCGFMTISFAFEQVGLVLRRAYLQFARPVRSHKLGRGARPTS